MAEEPGARKYWRFVAAFAATFAVGLLASLLTTLIHWQSSLNLLQAFFYAPGGLVLVVLLRVLGYYGADAAHLSSAYWVVGSMLLLTVASALASRYYHRHRLVTVTIMFIVCTLNSYAGLFVLKAVGSN